MSLLSGTELPSNLILKRQGKQTLHQTTFNKIKRFGSRPLSAQQYKIKLKKIFVYLKIRKLKSPKFL